MVMTTLNIALQRRHIVSARPFDEVVSGVTATIGRPDFAGFHQAVVAATTREALEGIVRQAVGTSA